MQIQIQLAYKFKNFKSFSRQMQVLIGCRNKVLHSIQCLSHLSIPGSSPVGSNVFVLIQFCCCNVAVRLVCDKNVGGLPLKHHHKTNKMSILGKHWSPKVMAILSAEQFQYNTYHCNIICIEPVFSLYKMDALPRLVGLRSMKWIPTGLPPKFKLCSVTVPSDSLYCIIASLPQSVMYSDVPSPVSPSGVS